MTGRLAARLMIPGLVWFVLAGCGEDIPPPDVALARDIRAGYPSACARTTDWSLQRLKYAMWDAEPKSEGSKVSGYKTPATAASPRLIGVTPGKAVICDVEITVGAGPLAVTRRQPYHVVLGGDFGPDRASFRFIGAGVLPAYAEARTTFSGVPVEWDQGTLPCSIESPHAEPLRRASREQAIRISSLLKTRVEWERQTLGYPLSLPTWVFDRVGTATGLGAADVDNLHLLFGAVCGPAGCDTEAFAFTVGAGQAAGQEGPPSFIPTGVLRTRDKAGATYVYRAFGHTASSYETCAYNALDEIARFNIAGTPVTPP